MDCQQRTRDLPGLAVPTQLPTLARLQSAPDARQILVPSFFTGAFLCTDVEEGRVLMVGRWPLELVVSDGSL